MPARQKDNHMYMVRHNNIFVYVDIMIIYIDVFNGFYDFFPDIGQFYCRGGMETATYNSFCNSIIFIFRPPCRIFFNISPMILVILFIADNMIMI